MSIIRPPKPPAMPPTMPTLPALPQSRPGYASEADIVRLRADMADAKREVESLRIGQHGVRARNRRYVADIDWVYRDLLSPGLVPPQTDRIPYAGANGAAPYFAADDPTVTPYDMLTAPFVVDQGTRFYVKQISFALIAVGTLPGVGGGPSMSANVVVPAIMRAVNYGYGAVNFSWKVRSTGSDRDWQNQFLPDWLLLSGSRNGLRFRRGQYCLVGGSEVSVTVAPTRMKLATAVVAATGLTTVNTLRFQFVFGGVEVES